MNSQFDEMIYQSGLIAQGCWDSLDDYAKDALFRSYQLIVEECASVAARTSFPYTDEHMKKQFGQIWDMACIESAKEIKRHFGVDL